MPRIPRQCGLCVNLESSCSKRKFPTRKKKKRRTHTMIPGIDGATITVPIEHHSTPVPLYRYKKARILSGAPRGDDNHHFTVSMLADHTEEMYMQRRFPSWNRAHRFLTRPVQFARLLAKIAHCFSTAELGIRTFRPTTIDLILGRSSDYSFTVGGEWEIPPRVLGGDHKLAIQVLFASPTLARVIVDIRLFSAAETPQYHVVAGEIDFHCPQHVASFEKHRADGRIECAPPGLD